MFRLFDMVQRLCFRKLKLVRRNEAVISFNFISMIPRVIFLVIMLTACVVLIRLFVSDQFNTRDVQAEVYIGGFIYGVGGVSYYDPLTGRHYPEIIDVDQLSGSELDNAFYFPGNNMVAARITLLRDLSREGDPVKVVYYNKEWYDNWAPLLRLRLPGIGGVTEYKRTLPVIYRSADGVLNAGYVEYQIVQPRG